MQTLCTESGLQIAPNWPKIWKNDNDAIIFWHDINVSFFWRCFVSRVKVSYWSKFHVNIITGSGIMTIFLYKGLTRNPEIGNTYIWVFPSIWRLGRVMDTKFGTNVSNRMLLYAAKLQGYSFYRFWVIKEKPTRGKITLPLTQIRVNKLSAFLFCIGNPFKGMWLRAVNKLFFIVHHMRFLFYQQLLYLPLVGHWWLEGLMQFYGSSVIMYYHSCLYLDIEYVPASNLLKLS